MRLKRLILLLNLFATPVCFSAGWTDLHLNTLKPNNAIYGMTTDSYGNLYVLLNNNATNIKTILTYDKSINKWKPIMLPANVIPTSLSSDSCGDINILQSTSPFNYSLWKYNVGAGSWTIAKNPDQMTSLMPTPLNKASDQAGNYYIVGSANSTATVWQYNCSTNAWQDTNQYQGTGYQSPLSNLVTDNAGNLFSFAWYGTKGNALWQYTIFGQWINTNAVSPDAFITYKPDNIGNLYALEIDNKGVINLVRYNTESKSWSTVKSNLMNGISGMTLSFSGDLTFDEEKNVYVSLSVRVNQQNSQNLVGKYSLDGTWTDYAANFPENSVPRQILRDHQGNIYVELYITNDKQQFWMFDINNQKWTEISAALGAVVMTNDHVVKDRSGNFYVATKNGNDMDVWQYQV